MMLGKNEPGGKQGRGVAGTRNGRGTTGEIRGNAGKLRGGGGETAGGGETLLARHVAGKE